MTIHYHDAMKEPSKTSGGSSESETADAELGTVPTAPEADASTGAEASTGADASTDAAFQPPRSIAPGPQLSSRALFLALAAVCLLPLIVLTAHAVFFGRASEHKLPVAVRVDRLPLPTSDGQSLVLEDVVVIQSEADFEIPNLTVNLNGQYFLYQDKSLARDELLIVRQAAFATKSSQRWVPGRYPIDTVTVTGKLPSGARGVSEFRF